MLLSFINKTKPNDSQGDCWKYGLDCAHKAWASSLRDAWGWHSGFKVHGGSSVRAVWFVRALGFGVYYTIIIMRNPQNGNYFGTYSKQS